MFWDKLKKRNKKEEDVKEQDEKVVSETAEENTPEESPGQGSHDFLDENDTNEDEVDLVKEDEIVSAEADNDVFLDPSDDPPEMKTLPEDADQENQQETEIYLEDSDIEPIYQPDEEEHQEVFEQEPETQAGEATAAAVGTGEGEGSETYDHYEDLDDLDDIDFIEDSETGDLDERIELLLMQDGSEGEPDEFPDEFNLVRNVEVYENKEDYQDYTSELTEKARERTRYQTMISNLSMKTLMVIAAGIMAFIVALGVFTVLFSSFMIDQDEIRASRGIVEASPYISNNTNYKYLNREEEFQGEPLILSKMLIDSMATIFYFDQDLDIRSLDFVLEDQEGRMYGMDLTSVMYDLQYREAGTAVRFEPLDLSSSRFYLTVSSPDDSCRFYFELESGIQHPPARYVTSMQEAMVSSSDIFLKVTGASFSSAGTSVHYEMSWNRPDLQIHLGDNSEVEAVMLLENGRTVTTALNAPLEYTFQDHNLVLGRMDFQPVKSLASRVKFTFRNLYRKYDIQQDIDLTGLFANASENRIEFELDHYKLVLERVGWQRDNVILVFHTENESVFAVSGTPAEGQYTGREESWLDAELVFRTAGGMEIPLKGVSNSGNKGTDMLFDTSSVQGLLQGNRHDAYLRLNSVLISMDDVTVEYDLDRARSIQDSSVTTAVQTIENAFEQRLAYKSGEIGIREIPAFQDEILRSTSLMSHYEPQPGAQDASYAAQFITYNIQEGFLKGVIQEQWKGIVGGSTRNFYRTHRIWAESTMDGWQIIQDEIIS